MTLFVLFLLALIAGGLLVARMISRSPSVSQTERQKRPRRPKSYDELLRVALEEFSESEELRLEDIEKSKPAHHQGPLTRQLA